MHDYEYHRPSFENYISKFEYSCDYMSIFTLAIEHLKLKDELSLN